MISILSDLDDLAAVESTWRREEQFAGARVFQTYAWVISAWRTLLATDPANRLWVVQWTQDGRKGQVFFPLYIDGNGTLRFILDVHSDICGAVGDWNGNLHWAYKELAAAIRAEKQIKRVWLQKMRGGSSTLNGLGVFLHGALVYRDNAYSWVVNETCDDFIMGQNQLKSKDRADLKGVRRKADRETTLKVLLPGRDPYPAKIVDGLVAHMLQINRSDVFFPTGMREFTEEIYRAGLCDILILERQSKPIALNFLLKKDSRYLSWIFLYADARASSAMYIKYLTEKARTDSFIFDFGVGVYDYKIGTFRPQTELTYSLRYSKSVVGTVRDFLALAVRMGKDWVKGRRAG